MKPAFFFLAAGVFIMVTHLGMPATGLAGGQLMIAAEAQNSGSQDEDDEYDEYDEYDDDYDDEDAQLIPDPLERLNRDFYHLNDTLYYVALKPAARVWKAVIPEELRTCVTNFFYNIRFPVRLVNCALQEKWGKAGAEIGRFAVNTTVGFLGIADVAAAQYPSLNPSPPEDLGLTFAHYGATRGGFFIMAPLLGPLTFRDAVGKVGDTFLDPLWWAVDDMYVSLGIRAGEVVNSTSFRIGDYEALQKASLDPYVAIRNGYLQYRNKQIVE